MTPEDDRRVAVHEAGHSLAALKLGLGMFGARLFDNASGLCTTKPETAEPPTFDPNDPPLKAPAGEDWREAIADATWSAAGQAAVDLLLHPERSETNVPDGHDRRQIDARARRLLPNCDFFVEMFFQYMAAAMARKLLIPDLWRIDMAAKELQRRRMMTGEEMVAAFYPDKIIKQPTEEKEAANADV